MAWTSPRTWVAGETPTAAIFNTHVRDNFSETGPAKVTTAEDILVGTGAGALKRVGVTSGKVLGSTAGAVGWITDPAADLIAAAGDILYGSAADTLAKLAGGSGNAYKALRLNAAGTAPEWLNGLVTIGHLYHSDAFAPAQAERWMVLTPAAAAAASGFTTRLWVPFAGNVGLLLPWAATNTLTTAACTLTFYKNGVSQGTAVITAGDDAESVSITPFAVVAGDYLDVTIAVAAGGAGTVDDASIVMTIQPTY